MASKLKKRLLETLVNLEMERKGKLDLITKRRIKEALGVSGETLRNWNDGLTTFSNSYGESQKSLLSPKWHLFVLIKWGKREMEVRYYEPSKDFNKAIYNAPFNLLLPPLGTDEEAEKKIIEHFEEVKKMYRQVILFLQEQKIQEFDFWRIPLLGFIKRMSGTLFIYYEPNGENLTEQVSPKMLIQVVTNSKELENRGLEVSA